MALVSCPECQRQVSDRATACPGCGMPLTPTSGAPIAPVGGTGVEAAVEGIAIGAAALPGFLHPALNIAGSAFLGLVNRALGNRRDARIAKFLGKLSSDIEEIRDRLDRLPPKDEKFADFAEDVLNRAAQAGSEARLDALRAVFLNVLLSERPKYDEAEEILNLIMSWQPRHLVLLRILEDPLAADRALGSPVGRGGGIATSLNQILKALLPEWDEDQIERTWKELGAADVSSSASLKAMMTDRGIHQLEGRIKPFGQKMVAYLRNPVN